MKHLLAASALLLASSAYAKPIAMVQQSGGFCRPACATTTLIIDDNGDVKVERIPGTPNARVEKMLLARLNQSVIRAIKKDIALVTPVPLVDTNPEGPMCMDIPEKLFTVVKGQQKIDIGADRNCKEFLLESYEAMGVVSTLRDLLNIANYAQR